MGKRGPLPKSRPERQLSGNASKRKLPKTESVVDGPLPDCPKWIGKEGQVYWKRIVPIIAERLKLTEAEWAGLVNLCQAWDDLQACTKTVVKEGRFYKTQNKAWAVHPAYKSMEKAAIRFAKFTEMFGLTPKTKGRLESIAENNAPPASTEDDHDDLDEFLEND